jgi:hypothetical protein
VAGNAINLQPSDKAVFFSLNLVFDTASHDTPESRAVQQKVDVLGGIID